jgi:hypothetical protein
MGGSDRGLTPLTIDLDVSSAPAKIELVREGFRPVAETIVPDRDQRVRVVLVRDEPAPSKETRIKKAPASKKPYRRFE